MAVENLFEDSPIYCFSNHPEIAQPSRDCLCYYTFLRGCCWKGFLQNESHNDEDVFTRFNQSGCVDMNFVSKKKVGEPWDWRDHRYLAKYKKQSNVFHRLYDSVLKQILVLMLLQKQFDFYWVFKFDIIYNKLHNQLWILGES